MKKYNKNRSLSEIKELAKSKNWLIDTDKYDKEGSDYITLFFETDGVKGSALFSTFNGRFFGNLDDGTRFSSDTIEFDNTPWFIELLDFFYEPAL